MRGIVGARSGARAGGGLSHRRRVDARRPARAEPPGGRNGAVIRQRGLAGTGLPRRGLVRRARRALGRGRGGRRAARGGRDRRPFPRRRYAAVLAGEVVTAGGRLRLGPGVRLERAGDEQRRVGEARRRPSPWRGRSRSARAPVAPTASRASRSSTCSRVIVAPNPELRPEVGTGGDGALVASGGWARPRSARSRRSTTTSWSTRRRRSSGSRRRTTAAPRCAGSRWRSRLAPLRTRRLSGRPPTRTPRPRCCSAARTSVLRRPTAEAAPPALRARLGLGAGRRAHVESQWISRQWLDLGNERSIPPSLTVGAGASVRMLRAAGLPPPRDSEPPRRPDRRGRLRQPPPRTHGPRDAACRRNTERNP